MGRIAVSEPCQFMVWSNSEQCPCGRQVPTLLPVETLLLSANGSAAAAAAAGCDKGLHLQHSGAAPAATVNSHSK